MARFPDDQTGRIQASGDACMKLLEAEQRIAEFRRKVSLRSIFLNEKQRQLEHGPRIRKPESEVISYNAWEFSASG